MARLSNLKSPIGTLGPPLKRQTDAEGHSRALEPWRAWYKLAEWDRVRRAAFVRDHYICQWPGCGVVTDEPIGDHKDPTAKFDRTRFFCVEEVQTLCKPCHDGPKQAMERGIRREGGYA